MESSYNSGSGTQLLVTIKNKKIEKAHGVAISGSVVSKSGNQDLAPVTNNRSLLKLSTSNLGQNSKYSQQNSTTWRMHRACRPVPIKNKKFGKAEAHESALLTHVTST